MDIDRFEVCDFESFLRCLEFMLILKGKLDFENEKFKYSNDVFSINFRGYRCAGEKECLFGFKVCMRNIDANREDYTFEEFDFNCNSEPYFEFKNDQNQVVIGMDNFLPRVSYDVIRGVDKMNDSEIVDMIKAVFNSI